MADKARVVIGASFGDEGKGLITDYLCSQGVGVVVRYNGGAQAGHTVVSPEGDRHVFHHFGSGSFLGVPTFLSQFFVCNPIMFFRELKELQALGLKPDVYAHPECLITTFPDMLINQMLEIKAGSKRHGSCGMGINETMNRSTIPQLKITMGDLWNGGKQLVSQLEQICDRWAKFRIGQKIDEPRAIEMFIEACTAFANNVNPLGIGQCTNPVFEGAQGLLLSQDNKEFFPHVTHSYTGMRNIRILCQQARITELEIYYVSRTYLTRHGAGSLPNEDTTLKYYDNTNNENPWQGGLRFASLEYKSLIDRCTKDAQGPYRLVMTHCDQLETTQPTYLKSYGVSRASVTK